MVNGNGLVKGNGRANVACQIDLAEPDLAAGILTLGNDEGQRPRVVAGHGSPCQSSVGAEFAAGGLFKA